MKTKDLSPIHLSARVDSVEVSPTVATAARATQLRTMGREILDFSVGEPDQGTPERIRKAAAEAMNRGETRYVPSLGVPALRKAVADRYLADDSVRFDPAEVAVTLGGKQAYALACGAILDPGSRARLRERGRVVDFVAHPVQGVRVVAKVTNLVFANSLLDFQRNPNRDAGLGVVFGHLLADDSKIPSRHVLGCYLGRHAFIRVGGDLGGNFLDPLQRFDGLHAFLVQRLEHVAEHLGEFGVERRILFQLLFDGPLRGGGNHVGL